MFAQDFILHLPALAVIAVVWFLVITGIDCYLSARRTNRELLERERKRIQQEALVAAAERKWQEYLRTGYIPVSERY